MPTNCCQNCCPTEVQDENGDYVSIVPTPTECMMPWCSCHSAKVPKDTLWERFKEQFTVKLQPQWIASNIPTNQIESFFRKEIERAIEEVEERIANMTYDLCENSAQFRSDVMKELRSLRESLLGE